MKVVGPKPDRPGLVAIGTDIEPVPLTGFAANFSPIPRIAPPPLGKRKRGWGDLVLWRAVDLIWFPLLGCALRSDFSSMSVNRWF